MKETSRGFTLTELMISTAFLGFLLVFVVTVIVQMMFIYNKGLSIRAINQSGRQVVDDMSRSLRFADADAVSLENGNTRLCADGVVYVWNTPTNSPNTYTDATDIAGIIRIDGNASSYCNSAPIDKADAVTQLTGSQTDLLRMEINPVNNSNGRLMRLEATFSTVGDNRPTEEVVGSGDYVCPTGLEGAFCAFGDFNSTVYVRN